MLVFAAAAQAGSTQAERNVAGTTGPPAGVFAEHVNAHPGGKRFQTLYTLPFLDTVAAGVSGWPLSSVLEDDPAEWSALFGLDPTTVLGFVCITVTDPLDACYHKVFLGPIPTTTLINWLNYDQAPTYWDAAIAIMTITHEADHYKLQSADEGRVNACALQQFPSVITTYFGIDPTVKQRVAVRKVVWRKKWVWVKRHGHRVRVHKRVRNVIVVYVQKTVQNPDYVNLVAAAQAFYHSQPPPYSTGTCT